MRSIVPFYSERNPVKMLRAPVSNKSRTYQTVDLAPKPRLPKDAAARHS
jgi:hypothetical protein